MLSNSAADQSNDNPWGDLSIIPIELILQIIKQLPSADILNHRLISLAFRDIIDMHIISLNIPKIISNIINAASFQHAHHLINEIRQNSFYLALEKKIEEEPEKLNMHEVFLYALVTDDINTISLPAISSALDNNSTNPALTDDYFISLIITRNTLLLNNVPPEKRTPVNTKDWAQNLWMAHRMPLLLPGAHHYHVSFTNLSHAQLSNLDFNYMTKKNGEKIGINMDHINFEQADFSGSQLEGTFLLIAILPMLIYLIVY